MARITLDIPDELYERLKAAAERKESTVAETAVESLATALERPAALRMSPEQARQLREDFGDELEDPDAYVSSRATEAEREARRRWLRSLPPLDPPLSQTVIEDREDRV